MGRPVQPRRCRSRCARGPRGAPRSFGELGDAEAEDDLAPLLDLGLHADALVEAMRAHDERLAGEDGLHELTAERAESRRVVRGELAGEHARHDAEGAEPVEDWL